MPRTKRQSFKISRKLQTMYVRFAREQEKLRREKDKDKKEEKAERRREEERLLELEFKARKWNSSKRKCWRENREEIAKIKQKIRAKMAKEKKDKDRANLTEEDKRIMKEKWKEVKKKFEDERQRLRDINAERAKRKNETIRIEEERYEEMMRIEKERIEEEERNEKRKQEQAQANKRYSRLVRYTDEQVAAGENFDRIVSQIRMISCANCQRTYPNLSLKSRNFCQPCSVNQTKFTAANSMDPGPVPPELANLTYIEQMLIAQLHPVVCFYKINNIEYAYRGNVINFRQDITDYAKILPVRPSELACTVLFTRQTPFGLENFRVRADRIRKALYWLKANNIYYNDIEISEYNLALLPEDGDVANEIVSVPIDTQAQDEEECEDYDSADEDEINRFKSNSNQSQQQPQIRAKQRYVPLLQPIDEDNLNEFTEVGFIARAFPVLFPTGAADLGQLRSIEVKPEQYFHYLMQYRDRRFVKDDRFRFFALNHLMRWQAQTCAANYVNKFNVDTLNAKMANDLANSESLLNEMMSCFEKLRSTTPFWRQRSAELLDMCEQIGMPKFMFTLSTANYHWPDLYRLIAPGIDSVNLTLQQQRDLMVQNADLVAFFFKERCEIFVKHILKPLFGVQDSWMRYEWLDGQQQGTPELTGLLWIDGLPCLEKDSFTRTDIQAIRKYFDELCCAINPIMEPGEEFCSENHLSRRRFSDVKRKQRVKDLTLLLNTVQRHTNCRSHCRRATNNNKRNSSSKCECKFPRSKQEKSSIFRTKGYYQFSPRRNDKYVNRFNAFVTQIWRTTTDFAPIVSWQAVRSFITRTVPNDGNTSESFVNMLKVVLSNESDQRTIKKVLQQLMMITLGDRNYSAQEVIHLLMKWPLCYSTRSFTAVTIGDKVPKSGLIHMYRFRPETMESWSLSTFAKCALVVNQVTDGSGRKFVHYIERETESILCVTPRLKLTDDFTLDEQYYRIQVILQTPFRCADYSELLRDYSANMQTYKQYNFWRERFVSLGLQHVTTKLDLDRVEEDEAV